MSRYVQMRNPRTKMWVKYDTLKKKFAGSQPAKYKNIPVKSKSKSK